jgi:hypothetical protein
MNLTGWAARIVGELDEDLRRDLAENLAVAIELHFGLTVTPSDAFGVRGAGGWCDGVSIIDGGLILYRPTPSRRENFTLMHELAHHLVASNIECLSWLADQPEPFRMLEQLCDQIAAELLVQPHEITAALDDGPPDADAVVALFEATEASRSACAIAVARKLPCAGFVVLVEEGSDEVFFAARARDTRPYAWHGDRLPAAHALRQDPPPARALAWWPYPTGSVRREYFMSATTHLGWVFAVFAENNLFGVPGFHIPQTIEADRSYDGEITCPCGYRGKTRWWPCNNCDVSQCPRCGECDCDRRERREKRVACTNCFSSVLPHLLVDGLCDGCR